MVRKERAPSICVKSCRHWTWHHQRALDVELYGRRVGRAVVVGVVGCAGCCGSALWLTVEPPASAIKTASANDKQNDQDDQECGAIHGNLRAK